ncbi:MAG TPA: phosphopantothenoylcysteine decarboxylase, partial [Tepidisphaeraceae bacterium]|nr:phosphopantothenoylcysteine decarboxylase [Tepidisphaeraceae bacterium]
MIDRVRDWGNSFTGNTGYAIARKLSELGTVDLLTSNAAHVAEVERAGLGNVVRASTFRSHAEL